MNQARVCPGGRLVFLPDTQCAVGLFHQNTFECSKCRKHTDVSDFLMKHPIRSTVQEPNARLYAAAAATGVGYEAISTIMAFLCLSITTKKHFLIQTHRIHFNLHQFAQKTFDLLIKNIRQSTNTTNFDSILDVCVSIHGTWKKRGHMSNYGVVFLIHVETGYCIDYEVLSLHCETCDIHKAQLSTKGLERWFKFHKSECSKNYTGTSKGMEAEGALRIFLRSLGKGLRYRWLVSDGDSSAYDKVKKIYAEQEANEDNTDDNEQQILNEEHIVEKVDCINHVKKRVINRLKDIRSRNTGYQDIPSIITSRSGSTTYGAKKKKTERSVQSDQQAQSSRSRKVLFDGKPFGGSSMDV